ncbi:MAG: guanylate kinase [Gammaproteobacteria bacterium]|nr:guanylate kinase [Gammaproteobacteria bacterium]MBQ0839092.1 guanylate kinase [Gammaproteobacteria bacterium]
MTQRGTLYTISAPSGAGKTSLVAALLQKRPNLQVSISHTTRPMRPGEVNGVNYHFVSKEQFQQMLGQQAFLEHAEVFDNHYGTSHQWVDDTLASGCDVILEIDWQGAAQIHRQLPDTVSIFVLPPSKNTLLERLTQRGQDGPEVIAQRIAEAQAEMSHFAAADYLIINDVFATALEELALIIGSGKLLRKKQQSQHRVLIKELLL